MTSPNTSPTRLEPPKAQRRTIVRRYAPFLLLAATVAVTGVVLASQDRPLTQAGSSDSTDTSQPSVALPQTLTRAEADKLSDAQLEQKYGRCDRQTLRVKLPSVYAPPCVETLKAGESNAGATYKGVTATEIVVAVYVAPDDPTTAGLAALAGAPLDPEVMVQTTQGYLDVFESVYNTYGRKVRTVTIRASGDGADDAAARTDAIRVAEEIGAFASFGGPTETSVYAQELAARGVLCFECSLALPDQVIQDNQPFLWNYQPTPEQSVQALVRWVVHRLDPLDKARFAGEEFQDKPRKFGLVNYDTKQGTFQNNRGIFEDLLAKEGVSFGNFTQVSYNLDLPRAQEIARTIIAKLKAANVTTVVFLGDPIMPRYIGAEATAQGYFPEWIIAGTVLTDTTALARALFDQQQWAHAFGISGLPARQDPKAQDPYYLWDWMFHGEPGTKQYALRYPAPFMFMLGVHLAGPDLNPKTFAAGMFSYPPTGGTLMSPQISFGDRGIFVDPDYVAVDDATELWYDPDRQSISEIGLDGKGSYVYSEGGKRYLPSEWNGETKVFDPQGAVAFYDANPDPTDQQRPEYPSPTP